MNLTAVKHLLLRMFSPKHCYFYYCPPTYLKWYWRMWEKWCIKMNKTATKYFFYLSSIKGTAISTSSYPSNYRFFHFEGSDVFEWIEQQLIKKFPDDGHGFSSRKYWEMEIKFMYYMYMYMKTVYVYCICITCSIHTNINFVVF